jgi:phosphatidylserine synthase
VAENSIKTWFTQERREAIYLAVAGIAPILVTAGVISEGQTEFVLVIASAALQAFAGLLALFNLKVSEAASWFTGVGRGIIYALAATVAPAAVGLGWVNDDASANILTWISLGLTALAAVISVIYLKPNNAEIASGNVSVPDSQVATVVAAAKVDAAIETGVAPVPTVTQADSVNYKLGE